MIELQENINKSTITTIDGTFFAIIDRTSKNKNQQAHRKTPQHYQQS